MVKIKHIDFGYNKIKRKLAELNGKKIAVINMYMIGS